MPPPMQPVPGHPYASYRAYRDQYGRFFIEASCLFCGRRGDWKKHCLRPELHQRRVFEYASMHAHGHTPRVRRR